MAMSIDGTNGVTFPNASTQTVAATTIGQTWTNVKTSPGRVASTIYTNSTGKTIQVMITTNGTSTGPSLYINGLLAGSFGGDNNNTGVWSFLVPNGSTYQYVASGGSSFSLWWELL
jgi:hypothetical protein